MVRSTLLPVVVLSVTVHTVTSTCAPETIVVLFIAPLHTVSSDMVVTLVLGGVVGGP